MATVSFIVTTYQKAPYVEELVASLADHGVPGGAELVIADDASPDGTVPALQSAFARHGAWFDKACLLVADRNSGPTHALNAAVASASGRYLHFVDGDDRLPAGAALAMAKTALAGAGLVYGGKRLFQGAEARDCFEPAAAVWSHAPLSRLARQKLVGIRFLAEREAVIAGGGADTSIFVQDVSLPLRIAARVDRLAVLPSPVVEVRRLDNSLSKQADQELHDYVLAVANFLDRGEAPPDAARILARRAWQRLARREGGRRWLAYAMRAVAASAVASEKSGEELRRACHDLARRVPIRLAVPAPRYHRLIETVPRSARA